MNAAALVVSIHDVSPGTRDSVSFVLPALARLGIRRVSLLVVPNYHNRGGINADPAFSAWLRDLVAAGHEAVLHGYCHQRERRNGESVRTRLFTRFYTADEGEFYDIALAEARSKLERGRDEIAQCAGAAPAGFIAPAWLLSSAGEEAARELGFAYTTRLKSVSDLESRRVYGSQSLCWSVRGRWRRTASVQWNALLFRALWGNRLLRVSIHPPDLAYPNIWYQIQHLAARALEARESMTYHDFVMRERR